MKKLTAFILALVLVFSLAACGNSGDNASNTSTPSSSGETGSAEETGETADDPTQVEDNGFTAEAVTVQIQDPESLAPFNGNSGGGGPIKHAIYQSLGARDGFAGEFKTIMIDTYEKIDDKTYSVTIFDDIYDSKGNHITADDVVFSWKKCQEVGELTETFDIEDVVKTGDYSVDFKWGTPMSLGAFELQMANVFIVSQAAYEGSSDSMATDPVGTGPYKLEKFTSGSDVVLVINENYWETEDQMDLAIEKHNVKTINFQVLTESAAITMALQSGTIDVSAEVNNQDLPTFEASGSHSVYSAPKSSGMVLCMNVADNKPLEDINLRMAITYATNAEFIAKSVNGGNNEVNYVMGGPIYLDYNNGLEAMYHRYDLDKAKEYMAQSEYADGVALKLIMMAGNTNLEDTGVILKEQLAQIGIDLTVEPQQFGNYLANEHDPAQWDFTICTFGADDYLSNAWKKYFDVNSTGTGTTKNFISDNHLQELIEACVTEEGHSEESINAFWQYISDNAWIHGLIIENDNVVYNSGLVSGLSWDNLGSLAPGGFVYVE